MRKRKNTPVEERVQEYSLRFRQLMDAYEQAERGLSLLLDQQENLDALDHYQTSGAWLQDFEADERGEIRRDVPRDVLGEDALFNLLEDIRRLEDKFLKKD